jgi:hypothetical protein
VQMIILRMPSCHIFQCCTPYRPAPHPRPNKLAQLLAMISTACRRDDRRRLGPKHLHRVLGAARQRRPSRVRPRRDLRNVRLSPLGGRATVSAMPGAVRGGDAGGRGDRQAGEKLASRPSLPSRHSCTTRER